MLFIFLIVDNCDVLLRVRAEVMAVVFTGAADEVMGLGTVVAGGTAVVFTGAADEVVGMEGSGK